MSASCVIQPIYQDILYSQSVLFSHHLEQYDAVVFLHSAATEQTVSRFSFIAIDPYKLYRAKLGIQDDSERVLDDIDAALRQFHLEPIADLPPFQGGIAGFLSYDLVRVFEKLPSIAAVDMQIPHVVAGAFDLVLVQDHQLQKAWIISSGLPELEEGKRLARARKRLEWLLRAVYETNGLPQQQAFFAEAIEPNFTRENYIRAVIKIKDYIRAGDIFQANLAQKFIAFKPNLQSNLQLFHQLMQYNPAPFAAFIRFGDIDIISSSPERFIRIQDRAIETRPIKGTISRSAHALEDSQRAQQLLNSEKDKAENVMIVDLMRNDLSKICAPFSVQVSALCKLETFATVHHLVSVIHGHVLPNTSFKTLLKAVIPGGSITGAPKIRAMEIIDTLEPTRRGAYCGNAFYYGFGGQFDSSILIRTYTMSQNQIHFQAGGAIILESDPEQEYEESLAKAKPLIDALTLGAYDDSNH